MPNISLLAEELLASQEGLCCMKTVCYYYCYSLLEHILLQKQALALLVTHTNIKKFIIYYFYKTT